MAKRPQNPSKMLTETFALKLKTGTKMRLWAASQQEHVSMANIVRNAIDAKLDELEIGDDREIARTMKDQLAVRLGMEFQD